MTITYIERAVLAVALAATAGVVSAAQGPRERGVSQGYEVEVAAQEQQWIPTGIVVREGQSLRFEATGEIALNRNRSLRARAGGIPNRLDRSAQMPSVPLGALIGQIRSGRRSGAPFAIGDRASVTMPEDGELFLGINDGSFADNTGAFAVWIDVPREGRGRGRAGNDEEYDFVVAAEQQWLATGIVVRQGQMLQVESSGEVTLNRSGSPRLGPRGNTSVQLDRFARLPGAPIGSLIGRIGPANQRTNRAFLIGDRSDVAMPGDGELFLGVNDSTFGDNGGSFAVRIDAAGEGLARGRGRGNDTGFENPERDVEVDGREPWVATGITVRQGDVVRLRAAGEVRLNLDGSLRARAGGTAGQLDSAAPLPDVAVGTLLGRIESGQGFGQRSRAFVIGDRTGVSMPADGELLLGINDSYFEDNGGAFTVTIETR